MTLTTETILPMVRTRTFIRQVCLMMRTMSRGHGNIYYRFIHTN